MYILGANMYILGANMNISGANMYNMYILICANTVCIFQVLICRC